MGIEGTRCQGGERRGEREQGDWIGEHLRDDVET